jgi:hypothetical protein
MRVATRLRALFYKEHSGVGGLDTVWKAQLLIFATIPSGLF